MKRIAAQLLLATALTGVYGVGPAQAEPVTLFLTGIGAGLTGATTLGGLAIGGALGAGTAVGTFLASNAVSLLVAGASLLFSAFQNRQMESSQVNFRQPNPVRRHAAGLEEVGGHVAFAAYGDDGAFWYMICHCDSELMETIAIKLDNVVVTLDGANKVTTEDFIAEESGWFGFSSRKPFYSVWTSTFTPSDPVPPKPAGFIAEFPEWSADHKLAGCTISVVKIDPVKDDADISGVYKWRGPIGLGEPAVAVVGVWNRIYDPRDEDQEPDDIATWGQSTNLALLAAWNRYRRQGFNMAMSDINWTLVADQADICDLAIEDANADTAPNYAGGVLLEESRENIACEMDILAGCDGLSLFDNEGKWYPRVGYWAEPSLTLTAERDIFALGDSEAQDGEQETSGVIVEYKEPGLGYVMQPCAPWKNPAFYVEGVEPRYLTIKVPVCKNHRQAVQLAKAYGARVQPTRKLQAQTGLRGRRARRERIIEMDYDAAITGAWQLAMPVEVDAEGVMATLRLVPVDAFTWTLLEGEEGPKPTGESIVRDTTIPDPTGVVMAAVVIPGSTSNAARLEAIFDEPARPGDVVEFRHKPDADTNWLPMSTIMDQLMAFSGVVADGATYDWEYRMRRGTRSTEWIAGTPIVIAIDPVAPGVPTSFDTDLTGSDVEASWINPNSGNFRAARLWRAVSGAGFISASDISGPIYAAPSSTQIVLDTPGTGTWDYWVTAENWSGVQSAPVGPETETVP